MLASKGNWRFVFIALLLGFSMPASAKDASAPKKLDIWYGNLLFGYWTLKMEKNQLIYEDHQNGAAEATPEIIPTTSEKWGEFKSTLDAIGAWQWKPDYRPALPGADGTQWEIDIDYGNQTISSRGDNTYPDEEPGNAGAPGKHFTAFLESLRKLTGKNLH